MNDTAIQRKYVVTIGYAVTGYVATAIESIVGNDDDDVLYILPIEELPVTLTYKPDKAKRIPRDSDEAQVEAQDRAIKVWRKRHPDAEFAMWEAVMLMRVFGLPCELPTVTGFDVRAVWERQIVDTIGLQ